MCSRFSRISLVKALQHRFLFEGTDFEFAADYNIAPTDPALVVVEENKKRYLRRMLFGLIPHWAKDPKIAFSCLNARAETVAEKPAFRESLKKRRCLVVTDGFYEWRHEGKLKRPFRFVMKDEAPFALAGLWDTWKRADGKEASTFAIITTEPNSLVNTVHDRMPVIVDPADYAAWLSPDLTNAAAVTPLLKAYPADKMACYEVSTYMNNSSHKGAESIRPK